MVISRPNREMALLRVSLTLLRHCGTRLQAPCLKGVCVDKSRAAGLLRKTKTMSKEVLPHLFLSGCHAECPSQAPVMKYEVIGLKKGNTCRKA